ncbi:oligoribonuclease [Pseudomonas baetica]|uniref:oligoribonuclease n=1 Tax=Pseudomonas TaxID=286 RepID=UPI001474E676|nr:MULTISPECIES: oligoribonuclease [Pseudomonas]MBX9405572.1 oligoribonuclease [Pseudomonas baetica]NMX82775.1 oligoribonuclease [Pseudomonas sp. WS 5503]
MTRSQRRLPWLDLETTGFTELFDRRVYEHRILEIGAVVTDEHFTVLASTSIVIQQPMVRVLELSDEAVTRMHTNNGLFDEVVKSFTTLKAAEHQLIQFYRQNGVSKKVEPLCGSGIHFDRMFIEAQMPELHDFLYYRNLDISSVKEFLKTVSPSFEPSKRQQHRALPDILESVAEAKTYRALLAPLLEQD